ncbi:MAG: methyltransferase domain-containing protein [Acidobacteriota bacterium]|nr:methyltransferase domain-containing protein [Acidobacteriota bacterium]
MTVDLNPQAKQMAAESMVRTLAAQAAVIWPQEAELIRQYALPGAIDILDAGCGTGECSRRLAELFPQARVLGVDVLDAHLDTARSRCRDVADRVSFARQSVFGLDAPDASFDLTVCRHVLHALPHAERALGELVRVTRPEGRLHLIMEDYGMLHFQHGTPDPREFWDAGPPAFGRATGTDLFIGRNSYTLLRDLGLADLTIDYVIVDTLRVPRETFAAIIEAWRDGYAEPVAEAARFTAAESVAFFNRMIANILDPAGYAVWMVPVVSARRRTA